MKAVEVFALIGGHVTKEVLLRNEYLAAENEILRSKIKGRLKLTDEERVRLAKIGQRLGKKALAEVGAIFKPETVLAWFRKLVAKKFDGSKKRKGVGRQAIDAEIEKLVIRFAEENPSWGYDRIVGALSNLGHEISDETVGHILRRHGIPPVRGRSPKIAWADFIASHKEVLVACDFFTTEVLTKAGLITYHILFFIKIGSREVKIAGITRNPNEAWMQQIARNLTFPDDGFLTGCRYLIMDRDTKFSKGFRKILWEAGTKLIRLPPNSPDLNAFAERWILSVKTECLSKLVLFGEEGLRRALAEFVCHYHAERNHQGKGNVILFPGKELDEPARAHPIECRMRLGGLLKYYYRAAA